jgi:hypothetical protein
LSAQDVAFRSLAAAYFNNLAYTYSSFVWVFGFTF